MGDPAATELVRRAHETVFGSHRVTRWPGSMSSEDFPILADGAAGSAIPTVYWMLGCIGKQQWASASVPGNHSPSFAPDAAQCLPTGITALVVAALAHLDPVDNPLEPKADPIVSCHPFAIAE
jgi:hippurate hydrolase